MLHFFSLGSGSCGNCYYISDGEIAILIDAGVGIRRFKRNMRDYGIKVSNIKAILITHDHADHIKAVGTLGEKYGIPVYTTPEIHKGINKSYCMTEKLSTCVRYIEKEVPIQIKNFQVTCFEVPHDGTDNVGYSIEVGGKVISFLTDLGEITPVAAKYINKTNYLILEANYDEEMLDMGPYPQYLKERIKGPNGHMCNKDTANFLAENIHEGLKFVGLCHLSKENNHPDLAYKTIELSLRSRGIIIGKDLQLTVLKRNTPTGIYSF